jgi:hypothetical protein
MEAPPLDTPYLSFQVARSLETLPILVFSGNYYLPRKLLLPETTHLTPFVPGGKGDASDGALPGSGADNFGNR